MKKLTILKIIIGCIIAFIGINYNFPPYDYLLSIIGGAFVGNGVAELIINK